MRHTVSETGQKFKNHVKLVELGLEEKLKVEEEEVEEKEEEEEFGEEEDVIQGWARMEERRIRSPGRGARHRCIRCVTCGEELRR